MLDLVSKIETQGDFWRAIGCRTVGAAVVTTQGEGGTVGFLALSATHLCASPPTMMISLDAKTSAAEDLIKTGRFCINYLSQEQKYIVDRFFDKAAPKGAERFADVPQTTLSTGAPALEGAVGVLDCAVEEVIERHGTMIVLGRLMDAASDYTAQPLVSFAGKIS